MKIGFTGTSAGMTNSQLIQVHMLLGDLRWSGATQATHGMCVGADKQFHDMARALGYFLIGLPGVTTDGRVFKRADCQCDLVMPEKYFLARNRDIASESDVMIATPQEMEEQIRSGTWATTRYARKLLKPLVIVWPNGEGIVENIPGVKTPDEYRRELVSAK